jgi:hypothetical protein
MKGRFGALFSWRKRNAAVARKRHADPICNQP